VPANAVTARPDGTVGQSPIRPDAEAKVNGTFDYASDLAFDGMLWGHTLRSPHPRALIRSIDTGPALALPGVAAVLTAADVPGKLHYGLIEADQPVLAPGEVNYQGEPVAIVAADTLDLARRAAEHIAVDYEPLEPQCDPSEAVEAGAYFRYQPVRVGDPDTAEAAVVVTREYEVGMQDQAPLGPESGVAVPAGGGLVLHVATQWLHSDLEQIAPCLGLEPERIHLEMAGIGGAFGAREDLSVQIHMAMLALRTGRPVKMMYDRAESFLGHVHRHPARMRYEHGADADGHLVYVKAHIVLDGGAYASTTEAVVARQCDERVIVGTVRDVAVMIVHRNDDTVQKRLDCHQLAALVLDRLLDVVARRGSLGWNVRRERARGTLVRNLGCTDSRSRLVRRHLSAPRAAVGSMKLGLAVFMYS
jgi:CO/xanthine dehydrogenase Mo-binding subunit